MRLDARTGRVLLALVAGVFVWPAHADIDVSGWTKVDEVPFDFERRRVSVLVEKDGARLLVVKGAPEDRAAHPGQPNGRGVSGGSTSSRCQIATSCHAPSL